MKSRFLSLLLITAILNIAGVNAAFDFDLIPDYKEESEENAGPP